MYFNKRFILLSIVLGLTVVLYSCLDYAQKIESQQTTLSKTKIIKLANSNKDCGIKSLKFTTINNQGNNDSNGANYVIIFNPKSPELDFKVSLSLAHNIYAKDAQGKLRKDYVPKQFHEIIADKNAKLNGKSPIAAINGDYIAVLNRLGQSSILKSFWKLKDLSISEEIK